MTWFVAFAAAATARTLREISDVVAVCCSTALPIVVEMSLIRPTTSPICAIARAAGAGALRDAVRPAR